MWAVWLGYLHDPPPFEEHEALGLGRAGDDLQHPSTMSTRPADQAAAVGSVGPDPLQARHPPSALLQYQATASTILHAGRVHQQAVNQAERVDQQMPLATLDQLAAIEATFAASPFDRLD